MYEAFEDGRIDEKRMREAFAFYLPKANADNWLWLGIDASHIARPDAVNSADRSAQYVHKLPILFAALSFYGASREVLGELSSLNVKLYVFSKDLSTSLRT